MVQRGSKAPKSLRLRTKLGCSSNDVFLSVPALMTLVSFRIMQRIDRKLKEWGSMNQLRSFLAQREIKDGIDSLNRDIDEASMKFNVCPAQSPSELLFMACVPTDYDEHGNRSRTNPFQSHPRKRQGRVTGIVAANCAKPGRHEDVAEHATLSEFASCRRDYGKPSNSE